MSRYSVEQWPPVRPGMQTGEITAGVRVTDTMTGETSTCTEYRSQYRNIHAAIFDLQIDADYLVRPKRGDQ